MKYNYTQELAQMLHILSVSGGHDFKVDERFGMYAMVPQKDFPKNAPLKSINGMVVLNFANSGMGRQQNLDSIYKMCDGLDWNPNPHVPEGKENDPYANVIANIKEKGVNPTQVENLKSANDEFAKIIPDIENSEISRAISLASVLNTGVIASYNKAVKVSEPVIEVDFESVDDGMGINE